MSLRLEAVVTADRNQAISTAADIVGACGGWIVDHSLLSDAMAVLNFRVPENQAVALAMALTKAGMPVVVPGTGDGDREISCQLTLVFSGASGDLRRDVPAFS